MATKAEIIAALASLADDDEVRVAVFAPEEEEGFAEVGDGTGDDSSENEDEPAYVDYTVNDTEVVDGLNEDGSTGTHKALLLYIDLSETDDDEEEEPSEKEHV